MFVNNRARFGQMGGLLPLVQMSTAAAYSLLNARCNVLERPRIAFIVWIVFQIVGFRPVKIVTQASFFCHTRRTRNRTPFILDEAWWRSNICWASCEPLSQIVECVWIAYLGIWGGRIDGLSIFRHKTPLYNTQSWPHLRDKYWQGGMQCTNLIQYKYIVVAFVPYLAILLMPISDPLSVCIFI